MFRQFYLLLPFLVVLNCQTNNQAINCTGSTPYMNILGGKCTKTCTPFWIYNFTCQFFCPAGTFRYIFGNGTQLCVDTVPLYSYCDLYGIYRQCSANCSSCTDSTNTSCTACKPTYYLTDQSCGKPCNSTLYWTDVANNQCVQTCTQPLFAFLSKKICNSTCETYQYANVSKKSTINYCYDVCPSGTFPVIANQTCLDCYAQCSKCNNQSYNQCSQCFSGYYLIQVNGTCNSTCPKKYPYYDVVNWQCQSVCPPKTYKYQEKMQCVLSCQQISKKIQYYLYYNVKSCLKKCPSKTYIDTQKYICYDCAAPCQTCYGTGDDQCSTCIAFYFLEVSTCVLSCSDLHPYLSIQENQCLYQCGITQYVEQNLMQCYTSGCPRIPLYYLLIQNNINLCVKSCPDGYFGSLDTYICTLCASQCAICFESTQYDCIKCKITDIAVNYFYDNVCNNICPDGTWYDYDHLTCQTSCLTGYFYNLANSSCITTCPQYNYGIQCVVECPARTFLSLLECKNCSTGCYQCWGENALQCSACEDGYFLQMAKQCVINCSSSSPYWDFKDKLCLESCDPPYVTNPQNYQCSETCTSGLVQDVFTCVTSCPYRKFQDKSRVCQSCDQSCKVCYGKQNSQCFSCMTGYFLQEQSCVSRCNSAFFYNDQINNLCQTNCPNDTLIWLKTANERYCISKCIAVAPLNYLNFCVTQCPLGSYQQNSTCLFCFQGCSVCTSDQQGTCQKCIDNYYYSSEQQSCYIQCPSDQYQDNYQLTCGSSCRTGTLKLNQFRLECVSQCPEKYYQYNNDCVEDCPIKTYKQGSYCVGCPTGCATCASFDVKLCLTCFQSYFLEGNNCVSHCQNKAYFEDRVNNICQDQCPDGLQVFDFPPQKYCLQMCLDGYVNYNGICMLSCPQYTYLQDQFCYDCSPQCAVCLNSKANSCSECRPSYFLSGKTCSRACPIGQYKNKQLWQCVISCSPLYTINDQMLCVDLCPTSPTNYYYFGNQCVSECPDQTYMDFNNCYSCAQECQVCFGQSRKQCTQCITGYYLIENFCADYCPNKLPYRDQVYYKCLAECSPGTLTVPSLKICVAKCPYGYLNFKGDCLEQCPNEFYSYNSTCAHCSPSCDQCIGSANNQCTYCKLGYYLHEGTCSYDCPLNYWHNQRERTCVIKCPADLYYTKPTQTCSINCPTDFPISNNGECVDVCLVGQYVTSSNVCQNCVIQCAQCKSGTNKDCYQCNQGNYLYGTTCDVECPKGYFRDNSVRQCVKSCPNGMYVIQEISLCSFSCPQGQYKEPNSMKCVLTCNHDQYPDIDLCLPCAYECEGCYGPSNSQCKLCKDEYPYKSGSCSGPCPEIGYTSVQGQCQKCEFKCWECQKQQDFCISCRGDRNPDTQCGCPAGYYDDLISENCTECPSKCIECKSAQFCTKCPNNQVGADCFCPRQPPDISLGWCIDCVTAFPFIYFDNNIDRIIIDMGYEVNLNLKNPFSALNENCQLLFSQDTVDQLGQNVLCYLNIEGQKQIIIQLGQDATIILGDSIMFKQNMIMDIHDPSCTTMIQTFFGNQVQVLPIGRYSPITPQVTLELPAYGFSLCQNISISIKNRISSGGRKFIVQAWNIIKLETNSTNIDILQSQMQLQFYIDNLLSKSTNKEQLILNPIYLTQFTNYTIDVVFKNFLEIQGTQRFNLIVSDLQSPGVKINLQPGFFYSYQKQIIPIQIINYQCISGDTFRVVDESFEARLIIQTLDNQEIYQDYGSIPAGVEQFNFSLPAYTVQNNQMFLLSVILISVSNPARRCQDSQCNLFCYLFKKEITFSQGQLIGKFTTSDRLVGYSEKYFYITADVYDADGNSTNGLSYFWSCSNLVTLQSCKYISGKTLSFDNSSTINIEIRDVLGNQSYIFYLQAQKQTSLIVLSQIIAITTNPDIKGLNLIPDYSDPSYTINPTSLITYFLDDQPTKKLKYYFALFYDWKVLVAQQQTTPTVQFRMTDYSKIFKGTNKIILYIFPCNQSIPMYFNPIPLIKNLTIYPEEGMALFYNFNISVDTGNHQVQFFYYLFENLLIQDSQDYSFTNGVPLCDLQSQSSIQVKLPSGVTLSKNLYILVKIVDQNGTLSTSYKKIQVTPLGKNIKENLQSISSFLSNKSQSSIQRLDDIHKSIVILKDLEQYSCYTDCSGYGYCESFQSERCNCQSERYLSDCSGFYEDLVLKKNLTKSLLAEMNNFIKNQTLNNLYPQRMIFEIQEYLNKHIQISEVLQILNATQLVDQIKNTNSYLSDLVYSMVDFKNDILINSHRNQSTKIPQGTDLHQITNQESLKNYFTVYASLLSINAQSFKSQILNPKSQRQIDNINSQIISTIQILGDLFVSIQVPGDKMISIGNQYVSINTQRTDQKFIEKILSQNISQRNFINQQQDLSLVLSQESIQRNLQSVIFYDAIFIFYNNNPYSYNKQFPYIGQNYPVYDIKLMEMGRKNNIDLSNYNGSVLEFILQPPQPEELVCIQLSKQTNLWINKFCTTLKNYSYINQTIQIQCLCQVFDTTTLIYDSDYQFLQKPYFYQLLLPRELLILEMCLCTVIYFLLLGYGFFKDKQQAPLYALSKTNIFEINDKKMLKGLVKIKTKRQALVKQITPAEEKQAIKLEDLEPELKQIDMVTEKLKYSQIIKSKKKSKRLRKTKNFQQLNTNESHPNNSQTEQREQHEVIFSRKDRKFDLKKRLKQEKSLKYKQYEKRNKYSCEYFHYQHGILQILFRYKENNPRWYRTSVIYGRYMSLLGAAGYLSYLEYNLELSTLILIGGVIVLRFVEYKFWSMLQGMRDTEIESVMFLLRALSQIVRVVGGAGFSIHVMNMITQQQYYSIQITVFVYMLVFDQTILEIIRFYYKKYFSGLSDKELLDLVKKLKRKKIVQQEVSKLDEKEKKINKLNLVIEQ